MCLYRKKVNKKWLDCKFDEEQDIDIVQSAFSQCTYYLQKGKSEKAWQIKVNITNYKEIKISCHLLGCNGVRAGEGGERRVIKCIITSKMPLALHLNIKSRKNMKERILFLGINNWLIEKLVSYFWLSPPHTIPQGLSKIDSPNCKAEDWPIGEQAPVIINPPTIALPEEDAGWDLKWLSTQEGRLGI